MYGNMSRKTHGISAAALFAATVLIFAGADTSGAFARPSASGNETIGTQVLASGQNAAPMFISEEVVQPVTQETAPASPPGEVAAQSLPGLVSRIDSAGQLSEELRCLAGAIYFESRGEPLAGQLAVAQVIINRTESGRFPASYCDVVRQPGQFSFVKGGRIPAIRTGSTAWHNATAIARIAHEGLWESEAQDALYFHAKYVRPGWTRSKIARATISRHVFYR